MSGSGRVITVELTAAEIEEAARTLDDLYAWNDAPPSKLAAKLRAAVDQPDPAQELRDAAGLAIEAYADYNAYFENVNAPQGLREGSRKRLKRAMSALWRLVGMEDS